MKTTKRSKMLLSSIAMLLVALVALGSATYAWYVVNKSVDATSINLKASAAEGLVIRKGTSGDWSNTLEIDNDASALIPAAIDYAALASVQGYTGAGTSVTNGAKIGDLSTVAITSTAHFFTDTFYVGYTGTANKTDVIIKAKGTPDTKSYMCLAVYVDGTFKGLISSNASGNTKVGNTDTNQPKVGMTAAGATVATAVTIKSTELTATGSKIDIIGFADGYDTLCKNNTAYTGEIECAVDFSYN